MSDSLSPGRESPTEVSSEGTSKSSKCNVTTNNRSPRATNSSSKIKLISEDEMSYSPPLVIDEGNSSMSDSQQLVIDEGNNSMSASSTDSLDGRQSLGSKVCLSII